MCADLFRLQFPLCPCAESSWRELILNFLRSNLKSKSWFVKTKLFKGRGTHRILSVCFPVFPGFLLLKWIGLFTFAVLVLIFQEHTSGTTWHNSIGTVHQSLSSGPWGRGGGRPDTGNARTVAQAQDSSERLSLNAAPEWMSSHRGLLRCFLQQLFLPRSLNREETAGPFQLVWRAAQLRGGGREQRCPGSAVLPRFFWSASSFLKENHTEISSLTWGKVVSRSPVSELVALDAFRLWNTVLALLVRSGWTSKILWFCYSPAPNSPIASRKPLRTMKPTAQGLNEDSEHKF